MNIGIIGAGPSGLICAYLLSKSGHKISIIEKNKIVGKKIYVTGKGRCNVTNDCDFDNFFKNIVNNPKFLYSAYSNFTSQDTMNLFEENGVSLVRERGNRVFPKSYKAADIANCLFRICKNNKVNFYLEENVKDISKNNDIFIVKTNKSIYEFDKVVIATGGKSYPLTGSTGDGYKFASKFNHTIITPVSGLCALTIKEKIPAVLEYFTQKNVNLIVKSPKLNLKEFGDITFYKEGLAGPISLTISSLINRISPEDISLYIDFKPALDNETLDKRLIREIQSKNNLTIEDLMHKLLPKEMIQFFFDVTKIIKETPLVNLSKETRSEILKNLKEFKLTYTGLENIDHAVITSGGISTKEINPKTMESKLIKGLYFAGEVIDVDAFTGGFNMQIAFSTGALAAKGIIEE